MTSQNNSKWVWIIAGGILQIPMIKAAKERGYKVMVTDRDLLAPGCQIVDKALGVDTYDIRGHIVLAKNLPFKPAAVLTVGADVGPTVSAVAEVFSLPAEKSIIAKRVRNKATMRDLVNQAHPVYLEIDYDHVTPNSNWKARCKSAGVDPYPCVLKPIEASGSKGITLIETPWQWTNAMLKARQFTGNGNRSLIVEERLIGKEYALDFFVYNKRVYFANAAERIFRTRGKKIGIEAGHVNPWTPPDEVILLAARAVKKLGVTFGPFKIDFINDIRYGWCVMECATRLSGGFDHMLTSPLATGKDITGFMLDMALGLHLDSEKLKATKNSFVCAIAPLDLLPGEVESWNLPKNMPGQEDIIVLAKDKILPLENNTMRPVFAFANGKTRLSAIKNAFRLAKEIKPEYKK